MELYLFEIKGHVSRRWDELLINPVVELLSEGITRITAEVPDQSALYGFISRVRDLGLPLLKVERVSGADT
jgi:hypothetical protein